MHRLFKSYPKWVGLALSVPGIYTLAPRFNITSHVLRKGTSSLYPTPKLVVDDIVCRCCL